MLIIIKLIISTVIIREKEIAYYITLTFNMIYIAIIIIFKKYILILNSYIHLIYEKNDFICNSFNGLF